MDTRQGMDSAGQYRIRWATSDDTADIAALISRLLVELYPELDDMYQIESLEPVTREVLRSANVFGLVAESSVGELIGVLMLNQCEAIYALGKFGEISELYVDEDRRSGGLGAALIRAAIDLAQARSWSMLEVGAPHVPRWQKTVDFYVRNGFRTVGPRLYLPLN